MENIFTFQKNETELEETKRKVIFSDQDNFWEETGKTDIVNKDDDDCLSELLVNSRRITLKLP